MLQTIYTICDDNTENRSQHDENGQKTYRRIQRRTGDEKEDNFIWDLGEEALSEMTKTVRDNDLNK